MEKNYKAVFSVHRLPHSDAEVLDSYMTACGTYDSYEEAEAVIASAFARGTNLQFQINKIFVKVENDAQES
jgi:hypothetical protein